MYEIYVYRYIYISLTIWQGGAILNPTCSSANNIYVCCNLHCVTIQWGRHCKHLKSLPQHWLKKIFLFKLKLNMWIDFHHNASPKTNVHTRFSLFPLLFYVNSCRLPWRQHLSPTVTRAVQWLREHVLFRRRRWVIDKFTVSWES